MVPVLLLIALIQSSSGLVIDFFRHLDVHLLDEKDYCEVVTDFPDFEDIDWFNDLPMYVSFNEPTCHPALFIKSLNISYNDQQICKQRSGYIKDPNVTYLFVNDQLHDLEEYFKDLFVQVPCILGNQPYFFTITQIGKKLTVDEVQIFSKSIQSVAKYEKVKNVWKIKQSWPDVHLRRANFQANEIIAHFDNFEKYGVSDQYGNFIGYHGDIGTMVQEAFNFTLTLHPVEAYGVKTGDNEYTGTVNDLYNHKIDMAMANFNHIPERLEVTEGGYSSSLTTPELIFWVQEHDHSFIYALVFDSTTWIMISVTIALSSITYFSIHFDHNFIDSVLEGMAISVKALLVLDIDHCSAQKALATRILLITLSMSGALLYWSYTGSLISFFTVNSEKTPIASFKDILDIPNMKLLMVNGTSYSQYILNAMNKDPELKARLPERLVWHSGNSDMYKNFMTEKEKEHLVMFKQFLFTIGSLKASYGPDSICKIRHGLLDNIRSKQFTGWLYPKNSLLKRLFDRFIIELSENGIERKVFFKYFVDLPQDKCETKTKPIQFHIVVTLFTMLGLGCILGLSFLCFEIISIHIRKMR